MTLKHYNHKGFTLAEVLITLGIIGVVAAMTIPTLMNNYLKNQTITRLQKFYTTTYQAINLSQVENGTLSQWNYGQADTPADTNTWFTTYLGPYLKYLKIIQSTNKIIVALPDGTDAGFHMGETMDVFVYLNGFNKSTTIGKDIFLFNIVSNPNTTSVVNPTTNPLRAYAWGLTANDRNSWLNYCITNHAYCGGLIMYDGWQIKSDYPYFN